MKTVDDAKRLAGLMVKMGKHLKREVVAVVTDMNQPLGLSVGNALEFREAVQLLSGQLPAGDPLLEVCLLLGTQMLLLIFAAITLGGLGTAFGALLGSLIVGIVVETSTMWIPSDLKYAGALVVLIIILLVRPQGLLGRKERLG